MPFVGDLRRMSITRLLELLSAGRKSGVVRLRGGNKEGLDVYLRRGRCEWVQPSKGSGLVESLVGRVVDPADRDGLRQLGSGDELGTVLMLDFLGISNREQSLEVLRQEAVATLTKAGEWQKGDFRFESAVEPPKGRPYLGLTLARITRAGGPN